MALSSKQREAFGKMAKLKAEGDGKAIAFFASVERDNPTLWPDVQAFLNGEDSRMGGGFKRSDVKVNSASLSNLQFRAAMKMANVHLSGGNHESIPFYAAQEQQATLGSNIAKAYLAIRDEVMAKGVPQPVPPATVQINKDCKDRSPIYGVPGVHSIPVTTQETYPPEGGEAAKEPETAESSTPVVQARHDLNTMIQTAIAETIPGIVQAVVAAMTPKTVESEVRVESEVHGEPKVPGIVL